MTRTILTAATSSLAISAVLILTIQIAVVMFGGGA